MFEKLKTEIIRANKGLHKVAEEIKEAGIFYPDYIFYDEIENFKTEKEIIQYLIKKDGLINHYNLDICMKFDIDVLNPIDKFEGYSILDRIYGDHNCVLDWMEAINNEPEEYPIDEFIEYLHKAIEKELED